MRSHPPGHASMNTIALLLGGVIGSVWVWKRLSAENQDYIIDYAIPLALVAGAGLALVWIIVRAVRKRKRRLHQRATLLAQFERETMQAKKLETAFALIEVNEYQMEGLESVVPALKDLFTVTLQRSVGDKQHRIRGMAASHLGVLQDKSVVPLLLKTLDDDHAYVRSCAALALGRLRAIETKDRLMTLFKDDWDQTVRSRAKEALDRMRA